jgi:outer membrane immunogenic protein
MRPVALVSRENDTRTGWTLGFGLEFTFWGNWSADLKYAHYDFGRKDLTFVDTISGTTATAGSKQWFDAITLGLNYHWGWHVAPERREIRRP